MKSSEFIVENRNVKYKDGFSFRNEGGYWWIYFNGRNYEHGYKDVDTAKAAVDQWIKNGFFNESIDPLSEGWKSKLAGAALATGLAASPAADAVVLNPARPINAQGGTVANPYPQNTKSIEKVTTIGGREYTRHELPNNMSQVKLTKDDKGRNVYAWIEKAGMRPQYTYYWFAPNPTNEEAQLDETEDTVEAVASLAREIRKR